MQYLPTSLGRILKSQTALAIPCVCAQVGMPSMVSRGPIPRPSPLSSYDLDVGLFAGPEVIPVSIRMDASHLSCPLRA